MSTNERVRHLIVWETALTGSPGYIEMYVNPNSLQWSHNKSIQKIKTKGGFLIQYWGEELTSLAISGETGSGGIEALNVIRDVYRSEQLALQKIISSKGASSKRRQSLAQLASSVVMWYLGEGYRGFFENFSYTESADKVGIFSYSMQFTIVETLGVARKNHFPWQRKPWSTADKSVFEDGRGSTTGGGYGSNFKIGELSNPAVSGSGLLLDPEYTSATGLVPNQTTLEANYAENETPITPAGLFARR